MVGSRSGLALLLSEFLPRPEASRFVITMSGHRGRSGPAFFEALLAGDLATAQTPTGVPLSEWFLSDEGERRVGQPGAVEGTDPVPTAGGGGLGQECHASRFVIDALSVAVHNRVAGTGGVVLP